LLRTRSGPSISRLSFAVNLPGLPFEATRPERSQLPLADRISPLRIIGRTGARLASFRSNKLHVRPTTPIAARTDRPLSLSLSLSLSLALSPPCLMRIPHPEILDILYSNFAVSRATIKKLPRWSDRADSSRHYCLPLDESSSQSSRDLLEVSLV